MLMCVNNKFDSDKDFKSKVGDVDTSTFVIVEVHLGLDTSAFAFALNYIRCSNNLMCVSNKFDSLRRSARQRSHLLQITDVFRTV